MAVNLLTKDELIRLHGEVFQHPACSIHGYRGLAICPRCMKVVCKMDQGARCECPDVSENALRSLLGEVLGHVEKPAMREKIERVLRTPEN